MVRECQLAEQVVVVFSASSDPESESRSMARVTASIVEAILLSS